ACSTPLEADILADDLPVERVVSCDISYGDEETAGKIEKVVAMEEIALSFDPSIENTEGAAYAEATGEIFISSTRGFRRRERRGLCSCSLSAVARRGEEVRSGWSYSQAGNIDALDFIRTGKEAARRTVGLLGSRPLVSGRYPVIFDGTAFSEVVYLMEQALSGEMLVKGTTVLAGKEGESVASSHLTLVDDPFLDGGCFNASFDDEGVPRRRYVLIEEGVLKGYLHNSWSARKTGGGLPGNAVRDSYKDLPVPGPSNLFVDPGRRSLDEMIADISSGIYIQNVMGMHTADPISGDFSVGISGLSIEKGDPAAPVSEMTISGNITDLLRGVKEVGGEMVFIGTYGAPPVLIEGLSVSGT
ncbi:MAG TPA: metallopeptidase TldD-related protein, partial [Candidatus Krumholzibacterium sp.]|nr:metallopeptidase TldD-related protein [Candidatus Krumholzibacterium sp.]